MMCHRVCHGNTFVDMHFLSTVNRLKKLLVTVVSALEPPHDKTNEMACAPSEDSDQPGYPPSLIRVFAVRMTRVGGCPV